MQIDPQILQNNPSLEEVQKNFSEITSGNTPFTLPPSPVNPVADGEDPFEKLSRKYNQKTSGEAVPYFSVQASELPNATRFPFVLPHTDYEELYAQRQGTGAKWTNALIKMGGIATTTFIQGTLGTIYGVGKAFQDGKLSSFYDNDLSRSLQAANDYLKDYAPNYYTQAEQNASIGRMLTANFWADKVLKNLGYAAGAIGTGAAWSSALRASRIFSAISATGKAAEAANAVESGLTSIPNLEKLAASESILANLARSVNVSTANLDRTQRFITAGMATLSEGAMEALQGAKEFKDVRINEYIQEFGTEPVGEELENIQKQADALGNWTLGLNVALLTATNYVQFPKILQSGFAAEKSIYNNGIRETENIIFDEASNQFVKQVPKTAVGKFLRGAKNVSSYFFSPSEAFEEGAQSAIQIGTEDFFNKKYRGSQADFLSSLGEGVKETLTTKEGLESIIIGGLSGAIMTSRGNFIEKRQISRNTQQALAAFNSATFSGYLGDSISGFNRALTLQEQRAIAIKNGEKLDANDLENDYLHNYLIPRIKYGRTDLVQDDINKYKQLASTQEGFQQLQQENIVLEDISPSQFLQKLDEIETYTRDMKDLYKSFNVRYSGIKNEDNSSKYSPEVIDRMVYAASKISFYDRILPTLSNPVIIAGINAQPIIDSLETNNRPSTQATEDAINQINNLDVISDIKEDLRENLRDAIEVVLRRKKFLKDYEDLKKNPSKYEESVDPEIMFDEGPVTVTGGGGGITIDQNMTYPLANRVRREGNRISVFPSIQAVGRTTLGETQVQFFNETPSTNDRTYLADDTTLSNLGIDTTLSPEQQQNLRERYKRVLDEILDSDRYTNLGIPAGTLQERIAAVNELDNQELVDNIELAFNEANESYQQEQDAIRDLQQNEERLKELDKQFEDEEKESSEVGTNPPSEDNRVIERENRENNQRKPLDILFESTTSPNYDVTTPNDNFHRRANKFLNIIDTLPDRDQIQVLLVTRNNQDSFGLSGLISEFVPGAKKQTSSTDTQYGVIQAVFVKNDEFLGVDGQSIGKIGSEVNFDQLVYQTLPDTSLEDRKGSTRYIDSGSKAAQQEQAEEYQDVWEDRRAEIFENSEPLRYNFSISRGAPISAKNAVQGSPVGSVITQEQLNRKVIYVPLTESKTSGNIRLGEVTFNGQTLYFPLGRPLLKIGSTLQQLNNRKFSNEEKSNIKNLLVNLPNSDGTVNEDILSYLKDVLYLRTPQGNPNSNQIWFENGYLFLGSRDISVPLVSSVIESSQEVDNFLSQANFNVNTNTLLRGNQFREIVGFENNKPQYVRWKSYQHYLLSPVYDLAESDNSGRVGERGSTPLYMNLPNPAANDPYIAPFERKYVILQDFVLPSENHQETETTNSDNSNPDSHILDVEARRQQELSEELTLLKAEDIRRPNGSIGTQGFDVSQMKDLVSYLSNLLSLNIPSNLTNKDNDSLKPLIDYIKSDESIKDKILNYIKTNPSEVTYLPDGTVNFKDGNHRANLLNLIESDIIPVIESKSRDIIDRINAKYDAEIANLNILSSDEPIIPTEPSDPIVEEEGDMFLQIDSDPTPANEDTIYKINSFLNSVGVTTESVERITMNGRYIPANGLANPTNKLIQVVQGKENVALPEEAMHIAVEFIEQQDPVLFNKMLNRIGSYDLYKQTYEQYKDNPFYQSNGRPDVRKIKKEAIGKVLAETIIQQNENIESSKLEQTRSWWQQIVDFLKTIFNFRNPFEQSAAMVLNDEIYSGKLPSETSVYLQLDPTQTEAYNKIYATSDVELSNTVYETIIDTVYERLYRTKKISKDEYDELVKQEKEFKNDNGHQDLTKVFNRLIDENGMLYERPLRADSDTSLSQSSYETLFQNTQERLSTYPKGTRFIPNANINDAKKQKSATVDLIAVRPDGTIDLIDFRFLSTQEDRIDPAIMQAARATVDEYQSIIHNGYNIPINVFGQKRTIPIILSQDNIQIGNPRGKEKNNLLIPIVSGSESTGISAVDTLIERLNGLVEKTRKSQPTTGQETVKYSQIADIVSSIRNIQLYNNGNKLINTAQKEVKRIEKYFSKYSKILNSGTQEEKDALKANDLSAEIINAAEVLDLYSHIVDVYSTELGGTSAIEGNVNKAEKVSGEARRVRDQIIQLSNKLRTDVIARGLGIQDFMKPEKVINFFKGWVRSLSQSPTKAGQILWKIVNNMTNKAAIEYDQEYKKLKKIHDDFAAYAKSKGISIQKQFEKLLQLDSKGRWQGNLIDRLDKKYYTDLTTALKEKDSKWIEENIDTEAYNKWYETALKELEEDTQEQRLSEDESKDQRLKEQKIQNWKDKFDINNLTDFSKGNDKIVDFPVFDKWESEAYKTIKSEKPLIDLYNYFQERNDTAYRSGMINVWEKKTFVPNIRKSTLERIAFGSQNKGNKSANLSVLNSIRIDVNDQSFGYVDPVTGKNTDSLFAMYTYDLGEKVKGIDNEEFRDYSDKSQDLFKIFSLWNQEIIKYKYASEVEDTVKLLQFTEEQRQAVKPSKTGGILFKKGTSKPITVSNIENSQYLKDHIDYYFYGKKLKDEGDVTFTFNYNKIADSVNKIVPILPKSSQDNITLSGKKAIQAANRWFSLKVLGFNLASAGSNLMGGSANAYISAGRFFTPTDMRNAQLRFASGGFYRGDGKNMAALTDYFVSLVDDHVVNTSRKLSASESVKWLSSDNIMFLQRSSDKMVQLPVSMAFFENTMVRNGELVNIREYVKRQNNYDSLYTLSTTEQARLREKIEKEVKALKDTDSLPKIVQIENDELQIPDGAGGYLNRTSQTVINLRSQIQQYTRDIIGNMSPEDISRYKMTVLGQSFMMFKNWIPRMADVRFSEFRFNAGTDSYEWGRIRMLANAVKHNLRRGAIDVLATLGNKNQGMIEIAKQVYQDKKLQYEEEFGEGSFTQSETDFIDSYVRGVRSSLKELGMWLALAGIMVASNIALDDDDDKQPQGAAKGWLRYLDRVQNELSFFYNPMSYVELANGNIFPAIGVVTDIMNITGASGSELWYLFNGDEEGMEKNKVAKYVFRAFPILKEILSYTALFNDDLARSLGIKIGTEQRRRS